MFRGMYLLQTCSAACDNEHLKPQGYLTIAILTDALHICHSYTNKRGSGREMTKLPPPPIPSGFSPAARLTQPRAALSLCLCLRPRRPLPPATSTRRRRARGGDLGRPPAGASSGGHLQGRAAGRARAATSRDERRVRAGGRASWSSFAGAAAGQASWRSGAGRAAGQATRSSSAGHEQATQRTSAPPHGLHQP
uniref:Uncharacterized protein n=1 Tax=Setaria viridis TaxID=4556 RepID=A0A4U6THM3_SETVI|nr:hypothetical protein SEVIR_8G122400v2 [Setaria viridis]